MTRDALTQTVLDKAQRVVQKFNRLLKSQPKFNLSAKAHPREGKKWYRREEGGSQVDCVQSTHRRVDCKSVKSTALG